jgi:hypothetical protein
MMKESLPVACTGKRKRYNPERREFRGVSYRSGRRVRHMRYALIDGEVDNTFHLVRDRCEPACSIAIS